MSGQQPEAANAATAITPATPSPATAADDAQPNASPPSRPSGGVIESLIATYDRTDLLAQATAGLVERSGSLHKQLLEERATVDARLRETEENIERYLRAFEAKTMPESICGPRIRDLSNQLAELRARKSEIAGELDDQPQPPTEANVTEIRQQLQAALEEDDERSRKAMIQKLTKTIHVTGRHQIRPVFIVPTITDKTETGRESILRAPSRLVRRQGLEPRTR